jgi:hypothetical protein
VIVERQRWTVQVERTGIADTPLAITQIKTRLNGIATPDVRRKIHALMDIDQNRAEITSETLPECNYLENLRRVLPLLDGAGIETVTVTFSGSGDSGAIDDAWFTPKQPDEFSKTQVSQLRRTSIFEDGQWTKAVVPETMSLRDALDNITNDYLEEAGINWYDNDGGFGELEIDVAERSVSLNINVNYTESTNEFCETKNIDTGNVDE